MNIFILSYDHQENAKFYNDRHVVKIIVEAAQLLSNAFRLNNVDRGYKMTHIHHPLTKWVCESKSNFLFVKDIVLALNDEWKFRYNHIRDHKSAAMVKTFPAPYFLSNTSITPYCKCVAPELKGLDTINAYRAYYYFHKSHLAKWTKRRKPFWYNEDYFKSVRDYYDNCI